MPKTRPAQQELYPDSGLLLSSTELAAIHQESKKDCLRLFHLLFDQFFTPEECSNSVAFGKHGKVPEGKKSLDKSKVNRILSKFLNHFIKCVNLMFGHVICIMQFESKVSVFPLTSSCNIFSFFPNCSLCHELWQMSWMETS